MENQKMPERPPDLGINVGESVRTSESTGSGRPTFINPQNDPRIVGVALVHTVDALKSIAQLAYDESKKQGKPVVLTMLAK